MNSLDFLRVLLSDSGIYCMFAAKGTKTIQKFYDTIEDADRAGREFTAQGLNTYFALGTYNEAGNRKAINVREMKSLFLDLDCGPSKEYPTQKAAIDDLRVFCKKLSLPKPMMVNSGNGVHVYWPLTEAVSAEKWLVEAQRLKQACVDNGLFADPVVTANLAQILRVPGGFNHKSDPPLPVEFFGVAAPEPVVLESL